MLGQAIAPCIALQGIQGVLLTGMLCLARAICFRSYQVMPPFMTRCA
jgi:hypothetical protein